MKTTFLFLSSLLSFLLTFAQVPQGISFQGVARDGNDLCIANTQIQVGIAIKQGTAVQFEERHTVTTDGQGLFGLEIGSGTLVSGSFASIDWRAPLSVETKINNQSLGDVALLTVPYAFQAERAFAADDADRAFVADSAVNARFAYDAAQAQRAAIADSAVDAQFAYNAAQATTAGFATNAGNATTANSAIFATSAGSAANAMDATNSTNAVNADFATLADTALFALNGIWKNQTQSDSLGLKNASGQLKALLQANNQGAGGQLVLSPATGNSQGQIFFDGNDQARLALNNGTGKTNVDLFSDGSENAVLVLRGSASGNEGTLNLAFDDPAGTRPSVTLAKGGSNRVTSRISTSDAGEIRTYGPNSINTWIEQFSPSNPDNGLVAVSDASSIQQASIYVDGSGNGIIAGDMKPFFMDHPEQPGKEIWYCAIEGPEAAAYERGTAQLVNGEAEIVFSDHFQIVANPTTLTITTSPWSADAKGLAVVERTAKGFKVKELFGGTGNYQFDWRVDAKRKGFEDFQVIRDKRDNPVLNAGRDAQSN